MAEQRMYKGRPIKANVEIKTEIIDGKEVEILVMPSGMKTPYVDDTAKKTARKTVKANPQKDGIVADVVEALRKYAYNGVIYKTAQGKYAIKTVDCKWFSLALTANKAEPTDKEIWEPAKNEEEGE